MAQLRTTFDATLRGTLPTTFTRNLATVTYAGQAVAVDTPRYWPSARVAVAPVTLTEFGTDAGGITFGGYDNNGDSIFGVFTNGTLRIWRGPLSGNTFANTAVTSVYVPGTPDLERGNESGLRFPFNSAGQVHRGMFVVASAIQGTSPTDPGVRIYVGDVSDLEALSTADKATDGAAHAGFQIVQQRATDGVLYDDDTDDGSGTSTQKVAARWCVTGPFTPEHDGDGEPDRTWYIVTDYRVKIDSPQKGGRAYIFSVDWASDGSYTVNPAIRWDIDVTGGGDHLHPCAMVRDPGNASRIIVYLPVGDLRTQSYLQAIRLDDPDNYDAVSGGAYTNVTDLGAVFGLNGGTGADAQRGGFQPLYLFQHPTDRTAVFSGKDERSQSDAITIMRATDSDGSVDWEASWGKDNAYNRTANPEERICLYGRSIRPWRTDSLAVGRVTGNDLLQADDDYIAVAVSPDGGLTWGTLTINLTGTGVASGNTGVHVTISDTDIVVDGNESTKLLYCPIPKMRRIQPICVGPGRSNLMVQETSWGALGLFGTPPSRLNPGDAGYVAAPAGLPSFAADANSISYLHSDVTNDSLTSGTFGRWRLAGTTTYVAPIVNLRCWTASNMTAAEVGEPGDCNFGVRITHGGTAQQNGNGAILQTNGIGEWRPTVGHVALTDDATARDIQVVFAVNMLDLTSEWDQFAHLFPEQLWIGDGSMGYPVPYGASSPPHEKLSSDLTPIGTSNTWTLMELGFNEGLGFDSNWTFGTTNGYPLATIVSDSDDYIEVYARDNGFRFRVVVGGSASNVDVAAGSWWPSHSYAFALTYDGTTLTCYGSQGGKAWVSGTATVDLTAWDLQTWHNLNQAENDAAERSIFERIATDDHTASAAALSALVNTSFVTGSYWRLGRNFRTRSAVR